MPVPRHLARIPLLLGTVALAGLGYVVFSLLHERGLVTGSPWVLALLVPLIGLTASAQVHRLIGHGPRDQRAGLRLTVGIAYLAAFCWTAGWSFLLPATALIVAVVHIKRSGSRWWRPAAIITSVFTVAGQVGVELGWLASVVKPVNGHVGAAWLLVLAWLAIANMGRAVAEQERSENALARTEARLRALMDSSDDVLTVSDRSGRLTYVSPAVERAMGHPGDQLVGSPLLDMVDIEHRETVSARIAEVVAAGPGSRASADVLVVHATQERRWYEWNLHNLLDDPLVEGLVVDQRDITDRLLASEALAHAAAHDVLTGLPNRGELMRNLEVCLPQVGPGAGIALLFVDLDKFKEINDTLGHAAGDELLIVVARRLRSSLRPHDLLARLGGDEFCVILTEIRDQAEVQGVVERLEVAVCQPVALGAGMAAVGASIGVALAVDEVRDPSALFAEADAAMYEVKRARKAARPGTAPRLVGPGDVLPQQRVAPVPRAAGPRRRDLRSS
ncbi:sensor domain-containing diguanylate cyclase [Actinotalea sp. C106]|uniref:diguanylate cyclase domain-containing protein n=1 Tax=Actinotalea sp. C106 TaxID=2908644 RepID=UPI002028897D|nr:sensor domain-containing diguanylate cyclase [Actinotalea sp. C106]